MKPVFKKLEFVLIYVIVSLTSAGIVRQGIVSLMNWLNDLPVTTVFAAETM